MTWWVGDYEGNCLDGDGGIIYRRVFGFLIYIVGGTGIGGEGMENMDVERSKNSLQISFRCDTEELEGAIEKADRLIEKLKEINQLASSLFQK